MTKRVYKTAYGKEVDLGALFLQNESVRAVGNMNVNARGDTIDSSNNVIEKANHRTSKQYSKQVSKMSTEPVATSVQKKSKIDTTVVETATTEQSENTQLTDDKLSGGLAAAIAKARSATKEKNTRN